MSINVYPPKIVGTPAIRQRRPGGDTSHAAGSAFILDWGAPSYKRGTPGNFLTYSSGALQVTRPGVYLASLGVRGTLEFATATVVVQTGIKVSPPGEPPSFEGGETIAAVGQGAAASFELFCSGQEYFAVGDLIWGVFSSGTTATIRDVRGTYIALALIAE